jgi:polar amino acid transport system substrate-binding protein
VSTPSPTTSTSKAIPPCNQVQSYDPLPSIPARGDITDATVKKILDRGFIKVGVSADTYRLAARNPSTSQIVGFDIDIANAVAKSLFGTSTDHIQPIVITSDDRKKVLQNREVDMVVRAMSMNCDRWADLGFSAEYYTAGQKVMVSKAVPGYADLSLPELKGRKVCAPTGTTSLIQLKKIPGPIPVTASNHTGCLVLLQQGQADAITGDDTVLAGLAAQDPNVKVTSAKAITQEHYGVGVNKADVYLARYINRVLADYEADGRWKASYDTWLAGLLGPAPAPPTPVYGR